MGEAEPAHYSAFLSYSHQDAAFARRLQRLLESYQVPRRLEASDALRPGSRRLLPVFRDRDELSASADLTGAVRAALAEARFLIVVCSPAASASEWVSREVALFRELHGAARVLCAVHPGTAEDAVPAALATLADGGEQVPLAADFRKGGDGERLALLKLVAVLAGVRLDELVQRDAHRRVQRLSVLAAGAVAGMMVAGGLAWEAVRARNAAEREQARSEELVDYMLTDLRQRLRGVGQLGLLDAVNSGALRYFADQDLSHLPATELEQRAALLQDIGEDKETRGDLTGARAEFLEAERSTRSLLEARPLDPACIKAHAHSKYWMGEIAWRLGDDDDVYSNYTAYARLAQELVKASHGDADSLVEEADADSGLAEFALRKKVDIKTAIPLFQEALTDYLTAARLRPRSRDIQEELPNDIADAYAWLAETQRLSGNFDRAIDYRLQQGAFLNKQLEKNPGDFDNRLALIRSNLGLARALAGKADLEGADKILREALGRALLLKHEEPADDRVTRQLHAIRLFEAKTWLAMPVGRQPPEPEIANAIGNCDVELARVMKDELESFCIIERVRLDDVFGDRPNALLTQEVSDLKKPGRFRLTEGWLLDLPAEARSD